MLLLTTLLIFFRFFFWLAMGQNASLLSYYLILSKFYRLNLILEQWFHDSKIDHSNSFNSEVLGELKCLIELDIGRCKLKHNNTHSVQFSRSVMSDSLWLYGLQHARPPCPSPTPGIYPSSYPLSRSSSVIPISSCLQSFPASGSFPMSQFFAWGGQSIGVSASTSVLPMNTQDWSPLGWTSWISLPSKGLSRVFSNTTVQKHQLFGAQLSL